MRGSALSAIICIASSVLFYFCTDTNAQQASQIREYREQQTSQIREYREGEKVRIAFVFAGSIRSFTVPFVHETLRHNLLSAFCPTSICRGDVFVRLSNDDNTHENSHQADGTMLKGPADRLTKALDVVSRLKYADDVKLVTRVVEVGSEKEYAEMSEITDVYPIQRIYRYLDARRYSMWFNRWKAYELALAEESAGGFKYDWVVHGRLDSAWAAPIKPYYMWSMTKMWVQDIWYADVPDTLALLPRNTSDKYYNVFMQFGDPKIMCLGGPNFDPATLRTERLQARGVFNDTEIKMAQNENCLTKLAHLGHYVLRHERANITWSMAGASETMLKRKLDVFGLSFNKGTLGFSTMFNFLVRPNMREFVCNYVHSGWFIPWMKNKQHVNSALAPACNSLYWDVRILEKKKWEINCDTTTYKSLKPLAVVPRSTCIVDKDVTNMNFLPYRVRRKDLCVEMLQKNHHFVMVPCVDSIYLKDRIHDYIDFQLFNLYPFSPLPQYIRVGDDARCLEIVSTGAKAKNMSSWNGFNYGAYGVPHYVLKSNRCHEEKNEPSQLFKAVILGKDRKEKNKKVSRDKVPGLIQWTGEEGMCLTLPDELSHIPESKYVRDNKGRIKLPTKGAYAINPVSHVGIGPCVDDTNRINKAAVFTFEKTRIESYTGFEYKYISGDSYDPTVPTTKSQRNTDRYPEDDFVPAS
jgi:hypothetical protein